MFKYIISYIVASSPWFLTVILVPIGDMAFKLNECSGHGCGAAAGFVSFISFLLASIVAALLTIYYARRIRFYKNNKRASARNAILLLIPFSFTTLIAFFCLLFTSFNLIAVCYGLILLVPIAYAVRKFINEINVIYFPENV